MKGPIKALDCRRIARIPKCDGFESLLSFKLGTAFIQGRYRGNGKQEANSNRPQKPSENWMIK